MKPSVAAAITLLSALAPLFSSRVLFAADQANTAPASKSEFRVSATDGIVEGAVTFRGEIPKSSITDDVGVRRDLLQVDRTSGGLQGVVVWLVIDGTSSKESGSRAKQPSNAGTSTALMDQCDHEFLPRVLAVHSGQPVKFINSDVANHNVRTSSLHPTNEFNVFTGVDGSYTHRFAADPQQRPIRLGCDIHPWMRGWIYVFDHPQFAVSDARGRFRVASVPPGRYKLLLRQPDIRYAAEREVLISPGQVTRIDVEVRLPKEPAREE